MLILSPLIQRGNDESLNTNNRVIETIDFAGFLKLKWPFRASFRKEFMHRNKLVKFGVEMNS